MVRQGLREAPEGEQRAVEQEAVLLASVRASVACQAWTLATRQRAMRRVRRCRRSAPRRPVQAVLGSASLSSAARADPGAQSRVARSQSGLLAPAPPPCPRPPMAARTSGAHSGDPPRRAPAPPSADPRRGPRRSRDHRRVRERASRRPLRLLRGSRLGCRPHRCDQPRRGPFLGQPHGGLPCLQRQQVQRAAARIPLAPGSSAPADGPGGGPCARVEHRGTPVLLRLRCGGGVA